MESVKIYQQQIGRNLKKLQGAVRVSIKRLLTKVF